MIRIKTHTSIASDIKFVKVSKNYECEIIYTFNQLNQYCPECLFRKNQLLKVFANWKATYNEEFYNEQTSTSHYLVFRRNDCGTVEKKVTEGFPLDCYGVSLFLVRQDNNGSIFIDSLTRWNEGEDCAVPDLTGDTKYVSFETIKSVTGLSDRKFNEIFDIWNNNMINLKKNSLDISLNLGENFSLGLNQEDLYNNDYVERVKQENINKTIDYEKRQFVLNYLTTKNKNSQQINKYQNNSNDIILWDIQQQTYRMKDDNTPNRDDVLHLVNRLTFDLYFRERDSEEYIVDDVKYYDYGEWETDDEKYWFDTKLKEDKYPSKIGGDLLGYLGFTDDDIYYQKECLKKSFLRLSIYDSPLRQKQKLLYYSTLFFDTNVLYKKYVDYFLEKKGKKDGGTQYVYDKNSGLSASFSCSNKFIQDASSDGFYLYLYDKIVEGNSFTNLFLKVEFNNAKTGKTVPLLWTGETETKNSGFVVSTDNVITTSIEYRKNTKNLKYCPQYYGDANNTNVLGLLNDLYIPIGVKYNFESKEYVWFIISETRANICPNNDGNLRLLLFEPRINKTE